MTEPLLSYRSRGSGFALVLLHGNGESGEYFSQQTEFFSRCYRVITVDTRGHGASARGVSPFTIEQFADDLKELVDSLGLAKFHLLGFSDGGNIALTFTLKYPDYVQKLVLNGANLSPSGVKLSVQIPICIAYGAACLSSLFNSRARAKKEMLALMVRQPHIDPSSLSAVKCPVLVIVGDRDMIKGAHSRKIAACLPNCELVTIKGDHFIAAKNSLFFNRAVDNFLRSE